MVEFPGEGIRARLGPRAILGSIAGGSLFVGASPRRLLSSLTSTTPVASDGYVAEVLEAVAIIGANTLVSPILGTMLTSLLVVGVMYEAFDLAEIRETAPLYTTWQFQLLIAVSSGGFGIILIDIGFGFEVFMDFLVWLFIVITLLFVFTYYRTDPTSLENPAVALCAKIFGHSVEDHQQEISRRYSRVRRVIILTILAATATFSILTMAFGFVVFISTLLYPLPEILVLMWVFAQVVGLSSLPIIGRITDRSIEDAGIEGRIFDELGRATSSYYTLILAFYYLALVMLSASVFSEVFAILLFNGSSFQDVLIHSSMPTLTTLYSAVAVVGILVATGYFVLYWLLQMLRLPAVAKRELGGSDVTPNPRYRRVEGLTIPAAALLIWLPFSNQFLYGSQSFPPMVRWVGALAVSFALILSCGWTIYRFRWARLDPQPMNNEEWVTLVASGVTIGAILFFNSLEESFFVGGLAKAMPISKAVIFPIVPVLLMGSLLYTMRQKTIEDLSSTSVQEDILLWGAVAIAMSIFYLMTSVPPVFPATAGILVTLLTIIKLIDKFHRDNSKNRG